MRSRPPSRRAAASTAICRRRRRRSIRTTPLLEVRGLKQVLSAASRLCRASISTVCPAHRRHHRPQRLGQNHLLQPDHRVDPARRRQVLLAGEDVTGLPPHLDRRARHRPHIPEPAPVRQYDADGERARRHAYAHLDGRHRRRAAHAACAARGGGLARPRPRGHLDLRQSPDAAHPASREDAVLCQSAQARDRARARLGARPAAPRRADGGHEPDRDARAHRSDPASARSRRHGAA